MSRIVTAALISLYAFSMTAKAEDAAAPSMPPPAVAHTLAPCDGGPHCVSSESREEGRHVAPIRYAGSSEAAQQAMARIISGMKNAKIVEQTPGYLHAEFTSSIMHFVDDLELVFAADHQIKLRSSSRIGYYDFGVNRDRAEALRKAFSDIQP